MINKIGRKIYFEKATGNVILTTSEMQGSVIETTLDQDFETYIDLAKRNRDTVGVIKLKYGEYSDEFSRCNGYRIDLKNNEIVFDYTPQVEEEIIREKTLEEKIVVLEAENTQIKTEVSSLENTILMMQGVI